MIEPRPLLPDAMRPILIHIHAFYPEFLPELLAIPGRLGRIPCELWVTYPEGSEEVESQLHDCNHALPVENRGYDIAPFLSVLAQVDLNNYSYVLKLHTKRDMQGDAYMRPYPYNYGFSLWREYLLNVCKTENLHTSLETLEGTPDLGMVADYRCIRNGEEPQHADALKKWLAKAGLDYPGTNYVMGSMFLCRAALLIPIQSLNLQPEDFPAPDTAHTENLAHTMERFIGASIVAQGYRIQDVFTPGHLQARWRYHLLRIKNFLYYRKRKADGGSIIKICKIPVWRG